MYLFYKCSIQWILLSQFNWSYKNVSLCKNRKINITKSDLRKENTGVVCRDCEIQHVYIIILMSYMTKPSYRHPLQHDQLEATRPSEILLCPTHTRRSHWHSPPVAIFLGVSYSTDTAEFSGQNTILKVIVMCPQCYLACWCLNDEESYAFWNSPEEKLEGSEKGT